MAGVGIRAEGLGVRFHLDRQRRPITPALARLRRHVTEVWALRDVDLSIGPGESVALLGSSGAGKTTLLRTMAGVLPADTGRVDVRGRVGSLLSSTAGLMGLLTGRENALLLGVLAGVPRPAAREGLEEVKAGTRLGEAFERPVMSYSQGMRARLGFVVAERAGPQVLLVDEVHEALDHAFRGLVERRAREIVEAGGVVVAAGHDHALLERFCTRALLLADGRIEAGGDFAEVRRAYVA